MGHIPAISVEVDGTTYRLLGRAPKLFDTYRITDKAPPNDCVWLGQALIDGPLTVDTARASVAQLLRGRNWQ